MKSLFIVTALVETGAGLGLLVLPAVVIALLLGLADAAPESLLVGRVAGAALSAIGVASWRARNDNRSAARLGLLTGILFYNIAATALLGYAGMVLMMAGIALWPAVALHAGLAAWCCLQLYDAQKGG
ncbi:MAG: hypothetical protein HY040_02565 [Planctomycetes bacterium]|nr:hypothetical protein [Planctomycetota bacterium]